MDIEYYLKTKTALIEERLDALIPEKETAYASLYRAARYSVLGNGKRLRPILVLAAGETFGKPAESLLSAACAIEMIHTYSLIHDDLPCMDNDDFRRGKPSLHKAFNEGHAILTGDYLLTYAFETIVNDPHLTAQQKVALIALIAKHSGCQGMISGQVMDIQTEGKAIDLTSLEQIHQYKTGALINASILVGAVIGDAPPSQLKILNDFGNDIGLAFQIVDDILDMAPSDAKCDKALAFDVANHKTTYVTLLGVEQARKTAEELYQRSISHLDQLDQNPSLLKALAKKLTQREK